MKIGPVFFICFLLIISLPAQAGDRSYKKNLKKWTRSGTVYSLKDFRAEIVWDASFLSHSLLKSQADLYARTYEIPTPERENFLNSLYQKRGDEALFFISFYSYNPHYNDIANQRGDWDLRLEVGGEMIRPSRIDKIKRPTPLDRVFYPYLTPWSRGYFVWFPVNPDSLDSSFQLTIHNPRASSRLVWP